MANIKYAYFEGGIISLTSTNLEAINNGFHLAFIGAAIISVITAAISLIYIKSRTTNGMNVREQ